MTTKIANLILEMSVNQVRLIEQMDSMRRNVGSTMDGIIKSANLAMKALGALGIVVSVHSFTSWIKGAIDAADAINDMSKATGIAGTTLFGLQYAAKMSGTTLEDTVVAVNKLSVSIGGNASKYEALGISAKDPIEAFKQLADVFKATEDPQQRAVLAAEALGKSWQGVAPLLSEGASGIQELIDAGIEMYGVTPEIIDGAARFNDQLDMLAMRSQAAALSLIGPFLNSIVSSMEEMTKATQIAGGFTSALFTFGAMNPFGTLEEGVARYKAEIEDLEKSIIRYQKSNSDTRALEDSLDAVKKRLEFTQYRLNQQLAEQARSQREAASASDAHIAAYSKMKNSADELISQMTFESSLLGMTNEEREKSVALRKLEEIGIRAGSSALDEYLPKLDEIIAKNKEARKKIEAERSAEAAARQAANEAKRLIEERQRTVKSIEDEIAQLKFEVEYMGKSNLEKEQAIFLQKLQNAGIDQGTDAWKKYADAYQAALFDKEQMQAVIDANKKIEDEKKKLADKAIADRLKKEEEFADEIKSINNQIGQSLTDALMTGGTNARDFLVNMFRTMVLRPILQPIITGVVGAFTASALTSNAAAAESAVSAGSVGNSFGLISMANNLKSAYEVVTGGFTTLGETVRNSVVEFGKLFVDLQGTGVGISEAGASLVQAAGTIGSFASIAAGLGAGLGIGNLISGGKSLVGGSSWSTVGGGTALGAAIGSIVPGLGTALGAAIGGSIGGLLNAAFGIGSKENTDSGIIGKLSASNTQGLANYQEWEQKGGWFRSDQSGSDWTNIDPKVQKYMNNAVATTAIAVRQYADILKLPAQGIAEFSFEIKKSLVGLTAEEAQKQIDFLLAAYGNSLAATVASEIGPFQRDGEEAGVTLARLATSLQTVNNVFDTLNITLMDASLYGADASSRLIEMFGSVEKFVSATDAYYQAFYTEQERAAKTTEQLTGVFSQLGLTLPDTNAGFRALVESARAAGNDGLFSALIKLAPTFNELQKSLAGINEANVQAVAQAQAAVKAQEEATAQAQAAFKAQEEAAAQAIALEQETAKAMYQALVDANVQALDQVTSWAQKNADAMEKALSDANAKVDDAFAALQTSIDAELKASIAKLDKQKELTNLELKASIASIEKQKTLAETARQTASDSVNAIGSIFEYLKEQISDILNTVLKDQTAEQGRSFISNSLLNAQMSGAMPDQKLLSDAVTAARGALTSENFSTAFEMKRANLSLASDLQELQDIAGDQKTIYELQLSVAENQLAALDVQAVTTQAYYDNQLAALDAQAVTTQAYYDSQLQFAQNQINELRGLNVGVLSISSAMANLSDAITNQVTASAAAKEAAATVEKITSGNDLTAQVSQLYLEILGRAPESAGLSNWTNSGLSLSEIRSGIMGSQEKFMRDINQAYIDILGRTSDAGGMNNWLTSGLTIDQIRSQIMNSDEKRIPKFANGGAYSGGLAMVGETGPELINFNSPGMVYNSAQTNSLLSGESVAEEVRGLRQDNQAQSRAIVQLQSRVAKVLERWEGNGIPETRVVA